MMVFSFVFCVLSLVRFVFQLRLASDGWTAETSGVTLQSLTEGKRGSRILPRPQNSYNFFLRKVFSSAGEKANTPAASRQLCLHGN